MAEHKVNIISTTYLTHNVKRFVVQKPSGYKFTPGQGTDVALDRDGWRDYRHPFTFTSLNSWDTLEFIIKIYREDYGITEQLERLHNGDALLIGEPWGAIQYKGSGVFIAGGAGITPFIAILRQLEADNALAGNMLIFSNRTSDDVILDDELSKMLGSDYYKVFTREKVIGFLDRRIDETYLLDTVKDFNRKFYICGPQQLVSDVQTILNRIGVESESIVVEE